MNFEKFKKNSIRYYGDGSFWNTNRTGNYYKTTLDYENSLYEMINNYPSPEDVARIVPDENGKPIFKVLDIDYSSIYRKRRNRECFPIINRGNAWYNSLTDVQKDELQTWYQQWLDAPETLIIPERPTWLK